MKRILSLTAMTTVAAIALLAKLTPTQPSLAQEVTLPSLAPEDVNTDFDSRPMTTQSAGDVRVKRMLDSLGVRYQENEDGDFQVYFEFENGRSQVAHILSSTASTRAGDIRYMFSPAYTASGGLSAQTANQLLRDNANRNVGLWQTIENDGQSIALYTARVDANANVDEFSLALASVLKVSDEMELALNGGDRF